MKKQMVTLLTLSTLAAGNVMAQDYTHTGKGWTTASANTTATCSHSTSRIDCAINLSYRLANSIFSNVSYDAYGSTFLPILQAAANASDSLEDLGPWANDTRVAVLELVNILQEKESAINKLMTVPAQFAIARKLKSTIRIIKRELQ